LHNYTGLRIIKIKGDFNWGDYWCAALIVRGWRVEWWIPEPARIIPLSEGEENARVANAASPPMKDWKRGLCW
jgi:hypothetical protein